MICISIAQDSRRFALVDMRNAAAQCDLLEVRLDRFDKSPDIGEFVAAKPKPIIFSCRRKQDGGEWDGTEEERLAILRQCIISKADYVEIEHDVADQVRPFPGCKRVISYYNLDETPEDLADIYSECQRKKPDVVKLVTRARTPEEAWPLVQILAKPALPTVAVGLGKPGITLAVLGRKMGAPWTYAALERGMEAYPDQATVSDLQEVYQYQKIDRATKLIGVTGFSPRARATVALVNAAFGQLRQNMRCLPLEVGSVKIFRKVLEAVRIGSVLIDDKYREALALVAGHLEKAAQITRSADVLASQEDGWHGYLRYDKAVTTSLLALLHARGVDKGLEGRTVLLLGANAIARALAQRFTKHGAMVVVASRARDQARTLAQSLQCRQVPIEAVYTTLHDVLVLADGSEAKLHPGYLKSSMCVADLSADLSGSELLSEASKRGCGIVDPRQLLLEHVVLQVKLISGKEVQRGPLLQLLESLLPSE